MVVIARQANWNGLSQRDSYISQFHLDSLVTYVSAHIRYFLSCVLLSGFVIRHTEVYCYSLDSSSCIAFFTLFCALPFFIFLCLVSLSLHFVHHLSVSSCSFAGNKSDDVAINGYNSAWFDPFLEWKRFNAYLRHDHLRSGLSRPGRHFFFEPVVIFLF